MSLLKDTPNENIKAGSAIPRIRGQRALKALGACEHLETGWHANYWEPLKKYLG